RIPEGRRAVRRRVRAFDRTSHPGYRHHAHDGGTGLRARRLSLETVAAEHRLLLAAPSRRESTIRSRPPSVRHRRRRAVRSLAALDRQARGAPSAWHGGAVIAAQRRQASVGSGQPVVAARRQDHRVLLMTRLLVISLLAAGFALAALSPAIAEP